MNTIERLGYKLNFCIAKAAAYALMLDFANAGMWLEEARDVMRHIEHETEKRDGE